MFLITLQFSFCVCLQFHFIFVLFVRFSRVECTICSQKYKINVFRNTIGYTEKKCPFNFIFICGKIRICTRFMAHFAKFRLISFVNCLLFASTVEKRCVMYGANKLCVCIYLLFLRQTNEIVQQFICLLSFLLLTQSISHIDVFGA